MYRIAQDKNSTSLIIEALLLQHKFELINGNLKSASEKIDKAINLTENNNLLKMKQNVLSEKKLLENEI